LVAGNYVAWQTVSQPGSGTGSKIIVYDWRAGEQAYAVDLDSLVGAAAFFSSIRFALQADGKLAVAFSGQYNRRPSQLAWFSSQQPTPHVLPVRVTADTIFVNRPLAMADDLIFARRADNHLIVTTLDGKLVDDIPAPDDENHYFGNLAFNSTYLSWQAVAGQGNGAMMCAGPFPSVPSCNYMVRDVAATTSGPTVTLRLSLTRPVRLRVSIDRCVAGVKNHRCQRPRHVASATRRARAGRNRLRLRDALRGRGIYRARLSLLGRNHGSPVELLLRR
jgi:hypothetical protein